MRRGFTIVELIMAMALLGLLLLAWGSFTRSTVASVESVNGRAVTSAQRQLLDTRVGEVSRVAPQLGDLPVVGAQTLSFRKRQAVTATVCAYTSPTVTIDLTAAEAGKLAVGDSLLVRVGRNTADTTDDYWAIARLANATPAAGCSGRPTTLSATFTSVIPSTTDIAIGASARFFSTRTYASTFVSSDSGYALVETVNGANPTRIFGYYAGQNIFTYLDQSGNPAVSAAAVRLVRATIIPYLFQSRSRQTALRENLEWGIRVDDTPSLAGTIVPIAGATTVQVRCTNPGATNYGDTRNACVFPLVCSAPLSQTQTVSCGAGYLAGGTILQESDKGAFPGCAWGPWYNLSNTCVAIVLGCTNPGAQNYNAAANTNNGTCTYCTAPGPSPSTNTMACPAGNTGLESQSCTTTYACAQTWSPSPTPTTVCGGWSTASCSCSAPLTQTQVLGCGGGYLAGGTITQLSTKGAPTTCAWGGWVTTSNTCVAIVLGCTNPGAQNYNPAANTDNGSCTYCTAPGPSPSTNTMACPAGNTGLESQSCTTTYACAHTWSPSATPTTVCGGWSTASCACTTPVSQWQTVSCGAGYLAGGTIRQEADKAASPGCAWGPWYNISNTCVPIVYGCTDGSAQNYNASANTNNGSCTYCTPGAPSSGTNYMACGSGYSGNETQSWSTTYSCANSWSPSPGTPSTSYGSWSTAACVPTCTPNPTTYTPYTDYTGPCYWGYQGFSTASCTTTTTYSCPAQTPNSSSSCGAWQNQGSGFGSGNCSCIMNLTGYLQVFADPIGGGWYSCNMYNQLTCMATGGIAWTYAGWSCGTTNTPWPGCLAC